MTDWQPVSATIRRASDIEWTSPLPVTGMRTASTTSAMIVHGAFPVNSAPACAGWTVIASTPSASAIRATSTAFRCVSSQPPRILTVKRDPDRRPAWRGGSARWPECPA